MNNVRLREQTLVLLADDDPILRLLARTELERIGFKVEEAENGESAIAVFKSIQPDMVLLDVMMPIMDGYTVCEALRKLPGHEHTPILMATGLDDIESINRAYRAGATDFITKPINWDVLGHRVQYIWRSSLATRALIESEERIRKSEERNRALLNAIPDLMLQIGKSGALLDFKVPKDFPSVPSSQDLAGKSLSEVLWNKYVKPISYHVARTLETCEMQICEHRLKDCSTSHSYEARIVVSGNDEVLAIVRDITDRKDAEAKIMQLAYYDNLTGLLNRHSFQDKLSYALEQAKRYDHMVAVIFLDLDRFKRINDTLGHNIGDALLKQIADKLLTCVRKSDAVARLSGDEFIILLSHGNQAQEVGDVAIRILDAISSSFSVSGYEIFIGASVGISVYPFDGDDAETLLKNADSAMYYAKDHGRNNFQFYTSSMNAMAVERLAVETGLRKALERGEFRLHYQPQISLHTGEVVGAEALIRWQHPERGLVSPMEFIPVAEETGLIVPLGKWVLEAACRQTAIWQERGLRQLRIAVNVSSYQFKQKDFLAVVKNALEISRLDPSCLELELTESAIMHDAETTVLMLRKLKKMGVRLAVDDFGTGYSSLSYLKRFPIDVLKIDRTFVRDVPNDSDDVSIVKAIIAMACSLNLEVIAEGVENSEQYEFLSNEKCDLIQGYLFSPPITAEAFTSMLCGKESRISACVE